jgi:hypothetical protein
LERTEKIRKEEKKKRRRKEEGKGKVGGVVERKEF